MTAGANLHREGHLWIQQSVLPDCSSFTDCIHITAGLFNVYDDVPCVSVEKQDIKFLRETRISTHTIPNSHKYIQRTPGLQFVNWENISCSLLDGSNWCQSHFIQGAKEHS